MGRPDSPRRSAPPRLTVGRDTRSTFVHRPELYSVRASSAQPASDAITTIAGDDDSFAVYRAKPSRDAQTATDDLPVYSAGENGPLAIATGRLFVRLNDGQNPEDFRDQFASAGLEIERVLAYAPSAAWLKPSSGGAVEALGLVPTLESLPEVALVEPQLLIQKSFK